MNPTDYVKIIAMAHCRDLAPGKRIKLRPTKGLVTVSGDCRTVRYIAVADGNLIKGNNGATILEMPGGAIAYKGSGASVTCRDFNGTLRGSDRSQWFSNFITLNDRHRIITSMEGSVLVCRRQLSVMDNKPTKQSRTKSATVTSVAPQANPSVIKKQDDKRRKVKEAQGITEDKVFKKRYWFWLIFLTVSITWKIYHYING
ncbi:hypothetical protein LA04_19415 [Enterobacter sp. UCD-UG_FMILLET]|uniref:hypothetical protein n=1 Tax=Enterobacter sp. UCD-UG_FMILLET TaxID=1542468 RepID=UPI0005140924|nr:hypothetical protein [Enterobacter sp. UCD-UG_FMILLET]KGI62296.1 hypothetical protein LA04_19415 [Enterobacter sp. UCD-UG_FMILLET]